MYVIIFTLKETILSINMGTGIVDIILIGYFAGVYQIFILPGKKSKGPLCEYTRVYVPINSFQSKI